MSINSPLSTPLISTTDQKLPLTTQFDKTSLQKVFDPQASVKRLELGRDHQRIDISTELIIQCIRDLQENTGIIQTLHSADTVPILLTILKAHPGTPVSVAMKTLLEALLSGTALHTETLIHYLPILISHANSDDDAISQPAIKAIGIVCEDHYPPHEIEFLLKTGVVNEICSQARNGESTSRRMVAVEAIGNIAKGLQRALDAEARAQRQKKKKDKDSKHEVELSPSETEVTSTDFEIRVRRGLNILRQTLMSVVQTGREKDADVIGVAGRVTAMVFREVFLSTRSLETEPDVSVDLSTHPTCSVQERLEDELQQRKDELVRVKEELRQCYQRLSEEKKLRQQAQMEAAAAQAALKELSQKQRAEEQPSPSTSPTEKEEEGDGD
ncbi:hypothetical protein BLNAU_7920 [Blattamonas nauphoetae]|uniref:Uncharacterized protein n=1 Tax=Blattamonas nauphoetae TaxID=2049346 RepID=A0ABQ9Y044_9EUKA|nr:hypothetical protein BLNAU_7920 [Blattamonas nauphoetae]